MYNKSLIIDGWERASRYALLLSKSALQRFHFLDSTCEKRVLFVAGVQRSGTNMMMQVLERSYETTVYHEHDTRAFNNYEMREPAIIRRLCDTTPAPCVVIKALCELQDLTKFMDLFAPAQTLWLLRHYNDVVNSMVQSFPKQAESIREIAKDRESGGWRTRGMSEETYAIIRQYADEELNATTAAALTWYCRNILFFEQEFEQNERVMLVPYESLVTYPDVEFKQIFEFVGLKYTRRISDKVYSNSIGRNEPPSIERGVRKLCDRLFTRFHGLVNK